MATIPINPLLEAHVPTNTTDEYNEAPSESSSSSTLSFTSIEQGVLTDTLPQLPSVEPPLVTLIAVELTWMFAATPWAIEFPTILFSASGDITLVIPRIFCSNPRIADSSVKGASSYLASWLNIDS